MLPVDVDGLSIKFCLERSFGVSFTAFELHPSKDADPELRQNPAAVPLLPLVFFSHRKLFTQHRRPLLITRYMVHNNLKQFAALNITL